MKDGSYRNQYSRRDFFRQSACAALGVTGLVNALSTTRLLAASSSLNPNVKDYKALVCLFMAGGNDSNNLLIPLNGEHRLDYEKARGGLSIPLSKLHRLNAEQKGIQFGFHPKAKKLAQLFNDGNVAAVCNVGTLAYPILSRDDYLSRTVKLPSRLFSHSDQQMQWHSSVPDQAFKSGWGGRLAELLNDAYNNNGRASMSVSLAGINSFQVSPRGAVAPFMVPSNKAIAMKGYTGALTQEGHYSNTGAGQRLKTFDQLMHLSREHVFEDAIGQFTVDSQENIEVVNAVFESAQQGSVDIDSYFQGANTALGQQLKTIAKMIAGRNITGNRRQIFFCQVGGYDTHKEQLLSHDSLTSELSNAMHAFYEACVALGIQDKVTTFTASDFNRTLTPNGIGRSAGTDHAWGGHTLVMGGAVKGRALYGHFPELKIGSGVDVSGERGRWIPTTSVDQYCSVLARWFDVEEGALEQVFPNLHRFDDPVASAKANLDYMKMV